MGEKTKAPRHQGIKASRQQRSRGAVLVITLLSLILLAALVFYVFNIGRAAQQRVVAQQAADATAYAGAGSVARAYNTIARNNINIARSLALINVLDSAPVAIRHTQIDQQSLAQAIEQQLARGVPDAWVRNPLREVLQSVQDEILIIDTADQVINDSGFNMRTVTWYDGPNGRGQLWRAIESLDATSESAFNHLAEIAQLAAIEGGQNNLNESSPSTALLLPAVATAPIERGDFNDFEYAVGNDKSTGGLTPQARATAGDDNWHHYRGPFDTVFGWRYINTNTRNWRAGSSRGGVPIGSGSQGSWETVEPDPQSYTVYGPQEWMSHQLGWFRREYLRYSRFAFSSRFSDAHPIGQTGYWMNELSQIKRTYLWPGEDTQQIVHPDWVNDFNDAIAIHVATPDRIHHTRFVIIEIKSKYPKNHPGFGSDQSWAYVQDHDTQSPRVYYGQGWLDPRDWGVSKLCNDVWLDEWQYLTFSDPEIGIFPQVIGGLLVQHPVYRFDSFMFAGIDIGEEEDVSNPHNFASRENLPAPIDFVHDQMPINDETRREHLTYLGVVQQDARAKNWSRKFDGPNPRPRFAIAEARVFNNHSWDLWTPMWHVQLEPVYSYDDWLATFERDLDAARLYPQLADVDLSAMLNDLTSFAPLAEEMLEH